MSKINVACLLAPLIFRFSCYTMELFFSQKPAAKGFGRSTNTNTTPLLHTMTHGIRVAHFDNSYDNLALQSGDYKACDQMFEALKLLPVFATKNPFGFFHFLGEAGRRGKKKIVHHRCHLQKFHLPEMPGYEKCCQNPIIHLILWRWWRDFLHQLYL